MTCSSRPTLAEITDWVAEYEKTSRVAHATVHVLPQDDVEHVDSGIVAVHLTHGPASIYLNVDCERRWTAALTERSGEFPCRAVTSSHSAKNCSPPGSCASTCRSGRMPRPGELRLRRHIDPARSS